MRISKHREESLKYDVQQHIFNEIHIVVMADETLSQIMKKCSQVEILRKRIF